MLKAYKYRILPTDEQKVLLDKHFGSVRFLYNLALETKQTAYAGNKVQLSYNELSSQLTDLKKECEWLRETMLKYKSEWKGKKLEYIGRFERKKRLSSVI